MSRALRYQPGPSALAPMGETSLAGRRSQGHGRHRLAIGMAVAPLVLVRVAAEVLGAAGTGLAFMAWLAWAAMVAGLYGAAKAAGRDPTPDGRPLLRTRFSDGRGSVAEPGGPPGDWLRLRELPLGVRRDLTEPGRPALVARVLGVDHEFVVEGGRLRELFLLMELAVRTDEPRTLDLEVRLVGPDGDYLQAGASPHRGYRDRFRYRHSLPYVPGTVSHYVDLEVHVPLLGVALPEVGRGPPVRAEVDLVAGTERVRLARVEQRFRRPPVSSHRAPEALEPLAEGELVILAAAPEVAPDPAMCPVCGAELGTGEPERRCPECDTPHHLDCWRFAHGCSTFGCTGGRVL